ncbi:hypothetical protein FB567DRAFT_520740 [Paraphoma chrysanthemicola]|uniref:NmrA-like domain-containing protein n=1 Tax=Paraphoma chrysanthemicola TaxID=798071 RepID=A0A8K0RBV6_9PLEO|nr:hypothetical protein FB567DRAFT_520740 [Paraphoma chrysanthemicola]
MTKHVRSVILIGASGNIGVHVLTQLLAHPERPEVTVLTREESTAEFPEPVRVFRSDYSSTSLEQAFKNQDVALSFLNYDVPFDRLKLIIDAAIKAGVDRFIPSDYGIRTYHERYNVGVATYKRKVVRHLEEKEGLISWTSFICNPWIEYCLLDGLLGFDLGKHEADIVDSGDDPFSGSTRSYVAQAVCNLITDPAAYHDSKNQYVHLAGHTLTQNKILSVLEKVSGKQWKIDYTKADDVIAEGQKLIAVGNPWGMALIVRAVTCGRTGEGEGVGDLRYQRPWDERLGLKLNDLEDDLRATLEGQFPIIHMPPIIIP